MSHRQASWEKAGHTLIQKFNKRGMDAYYCATKPEACQKILELIPEGASISWGGSESMVEAGVMDAIREKDYTLIDRGLAKNFQETRQLYAKAVLSDYFLMSANAFTTSGELVNVDGAGNRVACLAFGPAHVIVLASMNKMCATVEDAYRRVRTFASPANAIRVNVNSPCAKTGLCADCLSPDCICCQVEITRRSRIPGRIIVVLCGEELGY
ncbi:MAG: lactate utilization protein [Blautia sp.]